MFLSVSLYVNAESLLRQGSYFCIVTGDVAGIGWERSEGTPPPPGQAPKGRVYFTYCGQRLNPILEDVAGGMWPLVHIQKKVFLVQFNYLVLHCFHTV